MNKLDKDHIDALLWREKMGFLSKIDEAQLENYKFVYPDYFEESQDRRGIDGNLK